MLKKIKLQIKRLSIIFLLLSLFASCKDDSWRNIKIISPNKLDTISIRTIENKRYIYNGNSFKIPNNHALIDVSNVSELGDEIGVCWNKDGYSWKLISFYSKFEYNNLDKNKYYIEARPLTDNNGIPNHDEYFLDNCVVIHAKSNTIRPEKNAILIYDR